jgi:predicted RNA binding protein YcfA (HicA-like mRNA interferase family)
MPKLANLRYREISALLASRGFHPIRQEGSHVAFRGPSGEIAIVPRHGSKTVPLGTVFSILRQARIDKDDAAEYFR